MTEPTSITAGNSATWTRSLADHPASDGWTLVYYIISPTAANNRSFTATASGDNFLVTLTAATTSGWVNGTYRMVARVHLGDVAATVYDCALTVAINPANPPAGYDPRTWAAQTLEAVEAALLGGATTSQQSRSVTVGNVSRTIQEMSKSELLSMRNYLRQEVKSERRGGRTTKILHTFI